MPQKPFKSLEFQYLEIFSDKKGKGEHLIKHYLHHLPTERILRVHRR